MLVNLAWREAERAGIALSLNELMQTLGAIREVTLIYPPAGPKGQPRLLKRLTAMDQTQRDLFELVALEAFAPPVVLQLNGADSRSEQGFCSSRGP
jgi:hypothetical protein